LWHVIPPNHRPASRLGMTYLEMPPLVTISELHRDALRQGRSYQSRFLFGESLTGLGDAQATV